MDPKTKYSWIDVLRCRPLSLPPNTYCLSGVLMDPPMKTVRIRITTDYAFEDVKWYITRHPIEDRCIRMGDEFDAETYSHDGLYNCRFKGHDGHPYVLLPKHYEVVSDTASHACTCSLSQLMTHGCQCGGL